MQLRFLRLHSHRASQKVSYSCRAAPESGRPQPRKEIRFLTDSRHHSYAASLQGCLVSLALRSLGAWKSLPTCGEPLGGCLNPHSLGWGCTRWGEDGEHPLPGPKELPGLGMWQGMGWDVDVGKVTTLQKPGDGDWVQPRELQALS